MKGSVGRHRVDVLGVHVSAITMSMAISRIAEWIAARAQHYVCITGVHGVMESQDDPELRAIHNAAGMVTPDGMPMVWSAHHAGARHVKRVYGPDLMLEVARVGAEQGWTFYLYGGKDGVAKQLAENFERWYPGLKVVGWTCPPFRPLTAAEDRDIVEQINAAAPDIVWVGLSTPKQERWMSDHVGWVQASVMVGVGAAFDMHTGNVRQAPGWMQRAGLEWFFRLSQEPRRLWQRYLRNNPRFVARIVRRRPSLIDERVDPGLASGGTQNAP